MSDVEIVHGDCIQEMAKLIESGVKVDSIVTDPPYHLTSIVKRFGKPDSAPVKAGATGAYKRHSTGFMGKVWDGGDVAFRPETWRLCYDLLKPGGHMLVFGGTRTYHRMACAIEDAGFEIRDMIQWLYGSGFPKSHDVSKGIDRAAGTEREVIGVRTDGRGASPSKIENHGPGDTGIGHADGSKQTYKETIPATEAAREWQGWGTALKPSNEPTVWARKPLSVVPIDDRLLAESQILIGSVLCRLLSCANSVEVLSKSSPSASGEESGSALLIVAVLHGGRSAEWCEAMATFNSPETVSTCLNIASLWSAILDVASNHGNRFTTSTATDLITALRTLNSCLSEIIPATIIQAASLPFGELCGVSGAEKNLSDSQASLKTTQKHIAAAFASLHREFISASDAKQNFMVAARVANTALQNAITNLAANLPPDLSPSCEPIVLARKPLIGTVAANVQEHGTGALNIDGCRVPSEGGKERDGEPSQERRYTENGVTSFAATPGPRGGSPNGRWPSNVIHDGSPEVLAAFAVSGNKGGGFGKQHPRHDGATWEKGSGFKNDGREFGFGDTGTAARFFYCAKADRGDRLSSRHPTVKPVDLIAYLCRLITPPNGLVLDPFAGSGTVVSACLREGFDCIVIEKEEEYHKDIIKRLAHVEGADTPLFAYDDDDQKST